MENQEDIDQMTLEIMQDENLTWIEKKVAIAMVVIINRKGMMTEEEIDKELNELNVWKRKEKKKQCWYTMKIQTRW